MKMILLALCLAGFASAQTTAVAPTISPIDPNFTGCTDLNGDNVVDVADLALMLTQWGVSNCWNPAPTTKTYYMIATRVCVGALGGTSAATQRAVAVLRADRTQWANTLSGSLAFTNGGPNQISSVTVRRTSDNSLFLPLFGGGTTTLTANPWGFSVYLTDAQFDALTANPTNYRLYFGTLGSTRDICATFAEGSQPVPTPAPPGTPTAAPTLAAIPDDVSFTVSLDNTGNSICVPFTARMDGLTRTGTATLTMTARRTAGVLEGYSLSGTLTLGGTAADWWQQILRIQLTRSPAVVGQGPYVISSGPQSSNIINLQSLSLFISQGTDLAQNFAQYRLDIITGTSVASNFLGQSEICGPFVFVPPPPPGAPTNAPVVPPAPTPFPSSDPVFIAVSLANNECTPSGPFQNGLIAGTPRTGSANLLLSRTKAANVMTGSITFDVSATETITQYWNQVNNIAIRNRADNTLLVTIFGGNAGISTNPFDSLTVQLPDAQYSALASNPQNYYLIASSVGNPAGVLCGGLRATSGPNAATTVPAPGSSLPPVPFNFQLNGACSGSGSAAIGTAALTLFRTQPLASLQGAITFTPANFPASITFIGIYRISDDLLVQPLFSSGFNTITSSFVTINAQAEQTLVSALTSNPMDFRVQVNTQTFGGAKGEICSVIPSTNPPTPCVCPVCPTTVVTTSAGATTVAATASPTAAPTPFVAANADYTVTLDGTCSGNPTFAAATATTGVGSSADISVTYAPNPTTPTQITLSGSFRIENAAYRALVTSVSLYRNQGGRRVLMLNLWSGAAGTLSSPRTFTSVVSTLFAYTFQEFSSEFFLGTSIEAAAVEPISICGQVARVVVPTTTGATTAAATTSAGATTVAATTVATAPPTPVPAVVQTNMRAVITCASGATSTMLVSQLQLASNSYQGTLSGNVNPLADNTNVVLVIIQRRSGPADLYQALIGPGLTATPTFNSGFLSTSFSEGLRQNPADFDVVITYNTGLTCSGPLAFN